jgi:hypothetical protein
VMNPQKGTSTTRATLSTAAGPVTLGVRDGWPAMAAVTADGRLVAAFSDGRAEAHGSMVLDGSGLKGLLSLDGQDVRQSKALLVAPWESGSVTLPGTAERLAIVGDFREGRWTCFEQLPLTGGPARLTVDADRATCMILVCPAADAPRWQQQLTAAMLHPERIDGY